MDKLVIKCNVSFTDEVELNNEEFQDYKTVLNDEKNKAKLSQQLIDDISQLIIDEATNNGKITNISVELDVCSY